jgi:hypothetical protein
MLEQPFIWCVVANVTRKPHPEGADAELQLGLKRFAPGAKLYCFPQLWGDGGERVRVLGRHRNGAKLIDIVIASRLLTNWRVQSVFNPYVVESMSGHWDDSDDGRAKALAALNVYRESVGFVGPDELPQ